MYKFRAQSSVMQGHIRLCISVEDDGMSGTFIALPEYALLYLSNHTATGIYEQFKP